MNAPAASDAPDRPQRASASWLPAVAVVALLFILQNSQEVEVDFIVATTSTPLFFILLITFAAGFLAGWLWPHVRRDRKRERERD